MEWTQVTTLALALLISVSTLSIVVISAMLIMMRSLRMQIEFQTNRVKRLGDEVRLLREFITKNNLLAPVQEE